MCENVQHCGMKFGMIVYIMHSTRRNENKSLLEMGVKELGIIWMRVAKLKTVLKMNKDTGVVWYMRDNVDWNNAFIHPAGYVITFIL